MYLTARGNFSGSPATLLPLVLLLEPCLQRLEVLEQRAAVHLPLAGDGKKRVLPRLARAHREHLRPPPSRPRGRGMVRSASCHGLPAPIESFFHSRCPASLLPKKEHSCSGPLW